MFHKKLSSGHGILNRLNTPGEFDDWPFEELSLRLTEDGVDVPPDANPHDLAAFAEAFYAGRAEKPKRYSLHDVEFVDANGVEYVPRPRRTHHGGHHGGQHNPQRSMHEQPVFPESLNPQGRRTNPRRDSVALHHDNHFQEPPMFESEMTDAERDRYHRIENNYALTPAETGHEDEEAPVAETTETQEIRENFQFLDQEDATEDRIRNEFQPPSKLVAIKYADLNHPRKPNGKKYSWLWTNTGRFCISRTKFLSQILCAVFDPFREGSNSDLARFGVGVSLYFKTLKWMFWTFFVMFIVTLPQLVINAMGVPTASAQQFSLGATSLGHLTELVYYVNDSVPNATITRIYQDLPVQLPACATGTSSCLVDRTTLGMVYTALDLIAIIIFAISLRWLRYFTNIEASKITKHHITVEEYTIQVVKVPSETNEAQLKKFFADLTGEPVHDVFLIQDNGTLLNLYVKRGALINKLWKDAARVHLIKEQRRMKPGEHAQKDDTRLEKELTDAIEEYDKTYAKFVKINEDRLRLNAGTQTLSAFVTFETQQGFLRCMDLYTDYSGYFTRRNQPLELRLDPKKPLKVRQAPPPSTILWENTHVNWTSRRWRRYCTMFGTGTVLIATIIVVFFISRERVTIQNSFYSNDCALLTYLNNGLLDTNHSSLANSNLTYYANILEQANVGQPAAIDYLLDNPTLLNCYCSELTYDEVIVSVTSSSDICHQYYSGRAPFYILTLFASVVVSVVNIIVEYIIQYLSQFERHHSLVNMEFSICRRVFVVLTINTGLILLSVNADFPGLSWIGSGRFSDFSSDWYASVGTQITLTMILNVFTPHFFPLVEYYYFKVHQYTHLAYSQRELNEMYLGPVFILAYRVAQQMMTVFVTLLYSAGMPALYPIACCMFFLNFYVDKYLLFNFYRTPPAYSGKLFEYLSETLYYAIVGHLGFAVWMYSSPGIFWNGQSVDATSYIASTIGISGSVNDNGLNIIPRLSLTYIVPLYIALLIFLLGLFLSFCFTSIDRIRSILCSTVTCGIFDDGTIKRRYLNPDYTDAVENSELRGLTNYNILENPYYARLLGIDTKFAREHRHIASVHEASAITLPKLPKSFKIAPLEENESRPSSTDSNRRRSDNSASNPEGHQSRHLSAIQRVFDEEAVRADTQKRSKSERLSISHQSDDQQRRTNSVSSQEGRARHASISDNRQRIGSITTEENKPRTASAGLVPGGSERKLSHETRSDKRASLARAFRIEDD